MTEPYDSTKDTNDHINRVEDLLVQFSLELQHRGRVHDQSKLQSPEKELFDEYTPKLKGCTYGSDEYKEFLAELKVALDHHYAHNSHHPEFYSNGMAGMTIMDIVEMLVDWKAASERHADGDIARSIEINQKRFGYPDMLKQIFLNTAEVAGWLDPKTEEEKFFEKYYGTPKAVDDFDDDTALTLKSVYEAAIIFRRYFDQYPARVLVPGRECDIAMLKKLNLEVAPVNFVPEEALKEPVFVCHQQCFKNETTEGKTVLVRDILDWHHAKQTLRKR